MKINKANNEALIEALKGRDEAYKDIASLLNGYDYSDEDYERVKRIDKLSQFQKDLLYLSTKMSMYEAGELYDVSASILYSYLRKIKRILKGE